MQISMEPTTHVNTLALVALIAERGFQLIRYRNGNNRRLSEDKVRIIVQEELKPIKERIDNMSDTLSGVAAVQNVQAFKSKGAGK